MPVPTLPALAPPAFVASCEVRSGAKRAALVELYTSEGCSSCPPADQQLREIKAWLGPKADVVPLALHVDYWDSIGWKDRFAMPGFARRQQWLVQTNDRQTVYTPQFFVGGLEQRGWTDVAPAEVRRVNSEPAQASLQLQAHLDASGQWQLQATAKPTPAYAAKLEGRGATQGLAIFLAATQSGLKSQVLRGENQGATLAHDHVVRWWSGPLHLMAWPQGVQQQVSFPADLVRANTTIVAFVQDMHDGQVLQAVSCKPGA